MKEDEEEKEQVGGVDQTTENLQLEVSCWLLQLLWRLLRWLLLRLLLLHSWLGHHIAVVVLARHDPLVAIKAEVGQPHVDQLAAGVVAVKGEAQ